MAELKIDLNKMAEAFVKNAEERGMFASWWIPVREMLPENKTYVLKTIYIPGRQRHVRSGWYQDGFFHNDNGDVWKATDPEVKAWMPLPQAYREVAE